MVMIGLAGEEGGRYLIIDVKIFVKHLTSKIQHYLMRIFSKIVFICNCCFIISALLRMMELGYKKTNGVIPLPALEGTVAILGLVLAVIFNSIFALIFIFKKVQKSNISVPTFLLWFNIVLLPIEIWFAFFAH